VEGLKARRGDLSGPVLAILVTLVLLAIGAAIIAYFVLLGASPQQAVIAVVGQPTIVKAETDGFEAKIVIKNVGSTGVTLTSDKIKLNIAGSEQTATSPSSTDFSPGATATVVFNFGSGWSTIENKETVRGVLTIEGVGTLEVVFRVIKSS
jgi:archaellum component FlaG (FlaF/FlaG flagellin family)